MKLSVEQLSYALKGSFTISRGSRSHANVVVVSIEDDGVVGRGECVPYPRYGESCERVAATINKLPMPVDRRSLQTAMAPGAARNAVDCALWDLECKRQGKRAWELAGLAEPSPLTTAYTLTLDFAERMRANAAENAFRPLLKVKLGGEGDIERLEAVRRGAPDSRIVADANEGWRPGEFDDIAACMCDVGVEMVEQPFPADADDSLQDLDFPFEVCADESCHDRRSIARLKNRYTMINIKLDKAGGLTEALALKEQALAEGFKIMVGCMLGSSLAMAPALLVAEGADIVDLDGPLLLAEDHPSALAFEGSRIHPANPDLWG